MGLEALKKITAAKISGPDAGEKANVREKPIYERKERSGEKEANAEMGRARKEVAGNLAKIVRKSLRIAEILTDADKAESARVLRDAKSATHRIYSKEKKDLIEVPDHKTRLAAIALELAYTEGTPVQTQVTVNATPQDSGDALSRALQSPALREHLQRMIDRTKIIEAEVIQKSGGQKALPATEEKAPE